MPVFRLVDCSMILTWLAGVMTPKVNKLPLLVSVNCGCTGLSTGTVLVTKSSDGFGSAVTASTDAELMKLPVDVGRTVKVTLALAFVASVPIVQITWVPVRITVPWVALEDTSTASSGRTSVTNTLLEIDGP